ncbi:glucose-6-phosphate dehydrogenase [bacterium]|nr:glucose-6-phosphate dehydrogenase [bacterium]
MKELGPHAFIVIGGTGDLAHRKLLPAFFKVLQNSKSEYSEQTGILVGVSLEGWDDERYRDWLIQLLHDSGLHTAELEAWCRKNAYYQPLAAESQAIAQSYESLASRLTEWDRKHQLEGNRVFYLAIPPKIFPETARQLAAAGLNSSSGWTRLVIEKPFGWNLQSAEELNKVLLERFDESQIYRIDHYLGKDTVQNLAIFRFANMMFESVWNRQSIRNIQITVSEDLGIGDRAGYYDKAGALRDMIQNHATQLLTLIAMDAPSRFYADAVRDEKLRVLRSIDPIPVENAVFGQYTAGESHGKAVPGYLEETGVPDDSTTESFIAIKVMIANWRWQGVPFYLRTGKRLPRKVTEIAIVFRDPPVRLFEPLGVCDSHPDVLRIRLQPDEAFQLSFDVKAPGEPLEVRQKTLEFSYRDAFEHIPDAYCSLIADVAAGDQTHFVRADEVEASWRMYAPLLDCPRKIAPYTAGSWGPSEADALLAANGDAWQTPIPEREKMN